MSVQKMGSIILRINHDLKLELAAIIVEVRLSFRA